MNEEASVQTRVISAVRHEGAIPRYYRLEGNTELESGTRLIVEDPRGGEELVVVSPGKPDEAPAPQDLPRVLAEATDNLVNRMVRRQEFERKAFGYAVRKIRDRRLPLKIVRCILSSDDRVRLYFACESQVDYRDLLRDLSVEFGADVEMHQLGDRQAAAQLKGLGPCGRATCCSTFLKTFPQVNTRMAKDQGLSLTPRRLAGACGKLKCCLAYEADTYREYLEAMALKVGHKVVTAKGDGRIIDMDVLHRRVRVVLTDGSGGSELFSADHVARIKGGVRPELPEAARQAEQEKPTVSRPDLSVRDSEGKVVSKSARGERTETRGKRRRGGSSGGQRQAKGRGGESQSPQSREDSGSDRPRKRRRRRRNRGKKPGGGGSES